VKNIAVLFCIVVLAACATSQEPVPGAIREFLDEYGWQMDRFTRSDVSDLSGFRDHVRWYLVDRDADEVWRSYTTVSPATQWRGPIARFGLLYDPETRRMYTRASRSFPNIDVGQIYFLDLLIEAFLHVPTAFQVSDVNEASRSIEFTYLDQNTSHGHQEILFFEIIRGEDRFTLIRHRSWFRSGSKLRDALFYPPYHTRTVDEYHQRIAEDFDFDIRPLSDRRLRKKGLSP